MAKPSQPTIFEYYSYSTIDEYTSKKEQALSFNLGVKIPMAGSIKAQLDCATSEHYSSYAYNEMFVVEESQLLEQHELLGLDVTQLVHCVDSNFLKILNQEAQLTENLLDKQLVEYLYNTYGTFSSGADVCFALRTDGGGQMWTSHGYYAYVTAGAVELYKVTDCGAWQTAETQLAKGATVAR